MMERNDAFLRRLAWELDPNPDTYNGSSETEYRYPYWLWGTGLKHVLAEKTMQEVEKGIDKSIAQTSPQHEAKQYIKSAKKVFQKLLNRMRSEPDLEEEEQRLLVKMLDFLWGNMASKAHILSSKYRLFRGKTFEDVVGVSPLFVYRD